MSASPIAHALLGLIFAVTIKSLPLLVAAAGLSVCLRRAPAAARHMVWLVAIAGLFFLPLFSLWQPRLPRPIQKPLTLATPFAESSPPAAVISPGSSLIPAGVSSRPRGPFKGAVREWRVIIAPTVATAPLPEQPSAAREPVAPSRNLLPFIGSCLFIVWLAGALTLVLRLAVSLVVAGRIACSCENVNEEAVLSLVRDASRRLGGTPKVTVRLGRREAAPAVPMTIGFFAPAVLLPQDAGRWPADRLEAALLHELAHVRRRDWAAQMLASVACALYWFHPLVWLAARRMRVESEMACDDQVIVAGAPAADYAGHLLEMARALSTAKPGVPTAVAAVMRPQIEGRLKAILDRARSRKALSSRARAFALAFAVVLLVPLALLRFQARATAHLRPHGMAIGTNLSWAKARMLTAGKSTDILQTKGTPVMLSLKPSISKAAAALASLSLLTTPIPVSAQDSAPPAPPAPPAAASPMPAPDKAPVPANPGSNEIIVAPNITYTPAPPGAPGGGIEASGNPVIVRTPAAMPPSVAQGTPGGTANVTVGPDGNYSTSWQYTVDQNQAIPANAMPDFEKMQQMLLPEDAVRQEGKDTYDIKVTSAPVQALLARLCQIAGHNYTMTSVMGFVTVYLRDVPFEEALRSIAGAASNPVTYSYENGIYHFRQRGGSRDDQDALLPQKQVTLDLDNAPFDRALKDLCTDAQASYTIVSSDDKSVKFNMTASNGIATALPISQTAVTVHLRDVSFAAALRALLNATSPSLTYTVKDGIIYIKPGDGAQFFTDFAPNTAQTTYQWDTTPAPDNDKATDRLIQKGKLNPGDLPSTGQFFGQGSAGQSQGATTPDSARH